MDENLTDRHIGLLNGTGNREQYYHRVKTIPISTEDTVQDLVL